MTTMPDVNMQPLRDLLATHPEECAAVVVVLCAEGPDGLAISDIHNQIVGAVDGNAASDEIIERVLSAGVAANLIGVSCGIAWIRDAHRYAIARVGAAAWLREKCRMGSRAPRYEHEAAIVARVAHVLGCSPGNVRLGWRSGALDSIGVCRGNGPDLCGDDVAALFRAGFSVSFLGWDVPADCVGDAAKEDGEQR